MSSPTPPTSCPNCGTFLPEPGTACPICGVGSADSVGAASSAASAAVAARDQELALVRAALSHDYEVIAEVGRGGMAVVYRARERRLDREVALKVLPRSRSTDASFVERFQREARTAAQLQHPHIIPIYRVGDAEGVIYFAMQFVGGPSVATILRERGTLPPPEVRRVLAEVGDALAYASRRGVVHRDIKPDNILRDDESGRFMVSDFGIARSADAARLTETGTAVGTPRYMSPEQASGRPLDGRSDVYSLGVVAYQCLTGRVPFDEGDSLAILYAHVHTPVPRPEHASADTRELFPIVERMLAKDPARRFQSGEQLVQAVTLPEGARVSSPVDPTEKLGTVAPLREKLATLRPVARSAGATVRRGSAAVREEAGRAWSKAAPRMARWFTRLRQTPAVRWATATRRRTLGTIAVAVLLFWGGKTALHFAIMHRSRCPADDAAFSVMLDPVGATSVRRDLDVYYDVCGLASGTPYSVRLRVSRRAGGIRGLLGGRSSPMSVSFDEQARGPATRRHRTIDLPELDAGSYTLELSVTTDDGREGTRQHDFQFLEGR